MPLMDCHSDAPGRRPVRSRRAACVAAAALFLLLPALAQEADTTAVPAGGYVVEVIVFRGGSGGGGEDLGADSGDASEGDSATGGARTSRVLQVLPGSRLKLGGLASRLNATPGYRVVAHGAWVQTASAYGSRLGLPLDTVGLKGAGLTGTVHLERGQYLHLGFDLTLDAGSGAWRLHEVRRVRVGERHYFDHPAFGVIAVVSGS